MLTKNKPKNVGDIAKSKLLYKDKTGVYHRSLTHGHFQRKKCTGTLEERTWLIYS